MNIYRRHIAPRFAEYFGSRPAVTDMRRRLLPLATGRVLELGVGVGHNFLHYDPVEVARIVAIDPAAELLTRARRRARVAPLHVKLMEIECVDLPFDNGSFDTVVSTFSLSRSENPVRTLAEIERVLRPGGELLFCERTLSPNDKIAARQRRLAPLWRKLTGDQFLDRDVVELLEQTELHLDLGESAYWGFPRWATHFVEGRAKKPAAKVEPTPVPLPSASVRRRNIYEQFKQRLADLAFL
jgi:SAM-dependent methyltransferase